MFGNKSHFTRLAKWGTGYGKTQSYHIIFVRIVAECERELKDKYIQTHAHTQVYSRTHYKSTK